MRDRDTYLRESAIFGQNTITPSLSLSRPISHIHTNYSKKFRVAYAQ